MPLPSLNPFARTSRSETQDPHRTLSELLNGLYLQHGSRWSNTVKASIICQIWYTVWQDPEWTQYFVPERTPLPRYNNIKEWLVDGPEGSQPWTMSAVQEMLEEQRKKEGKDPIWPSRKGQICGKVFQRHDRTYTCKTCATSPSVSLCVDCFKASDHVDHEILFAQSFSFSASCDCGDPNAWKASNCGCLHHQPLPSGTDPPLFPSKFDVPDEFVISLQKTIAICIEFIIHTIEHSHLLSEFGQLPKTEEEMRTADSPTGEPKEKRGKGPWAVVLWQDDRHVLKEIARQVRDGLGIKWELADSWAREAINMGRKVILVSPNPVIAFHAANMLQQIDAPVSLRLAADVFKEDIVTVLIEWLCDIRSCIIGGDDRLSKRLIANALFEKRILPPAVPGTPLAADLHELACGKLGGQLQEIKRIDWLLQLDSRLWKMTKWQMRQIYSSVFCSDVEVRKAFACRFALNYSRLAEHFLFQDREFDANILFSSAYLVFTNGAATVHASAQANLFSNVIQVAHAWYTNQVVNDNGLDRLIIPPIPFDPKDPTSRGLDLDVPAFAGKKGLAILGHLRLMLRHDEMKLLLVKQNQFFLRILGFLNMFVGIQPQRRERMGHVEYEVEWLKSFIVLGDLARICRDLGKVFSVASPESLLQSLHFVSSRIFYDILLMSNTLDKERYPRLVEHVLNNVLTPGSSYTLLQLDVSAIEAFSFHHYLNLLFAEMARNLSKVMSWGSGGASFKEIVEKLIFRGTAEEDLERMKLMIIEWPLQKHVIFAQIRANMWKKNGSALRLQHHHYCDVSVREATIDQEFYLLQFGLSILDPSKFMTALIDRFGLSKWFMGNVSDPSLWYDEEIEPKQRINLMEDFLLLVIQLASYSALVNDWDRTKLTRKIIIHHLAVLPMTYSELFKKLPERSQEISCTPILAEVANFREPTETTPGQYSLKDELFDEVDIYWRYYSRNDQRAVMDKLVVRAKKTQNKEEPLILPRPIELPPNHHPCSTMGDFLKSHVVADIIHWSLAHCMHIASPEVWSATVQGAFPQEFNDTPLIPTWDFVLDYTLHLAMMAISVAPIEFAQQSVYLKGLEGSNSTFQNLWVIQSDSAFKAFKSRVDYILDTVVAHLPHHYTADYRSHKESESLLTLSPPGPDPKAAAQARQRAIMAKFAKQQQDFAAMMDMEGLDDDDEDMLEEKRENNEEESYGSCIVCQEEVTLKNPGGMLTLLQPSRQLREVVNTRDWFEESLLVPTSLDRPGRYHRFGFNPDEQEPTSTDSYPCGNLKFGIHMSACGHYMHESCMTNHFEGTKVRHTQQVQRHHPENAVRLEYMCPLCKSLGNALIPVEPSQTKNKFPVTIREDEDEVPSLSVVIRRVSSEGLLKVADSQRIWEHHVETGEVVPWFSDCVFSLHSLDHNHRRGVMRVVSRMADRMGGLVRPLSEQSQRIRGKKTHMYLPDDMVAYTVSMAEVTQRGLSTNNSDALTVAEQINETSLVLVGKLIGLLQLELDLYFGPAFDRTSLRVGIFARFLPDWYRSSTLPSPLLIRQPLGMVIECAAIAPDLLQSVIIMAYFAELTRCMLAMSLCVKRCLGPRAQPAARSKPPEDLTLSDGLSVFKDFRPVMQNILRHAGPFADTDGVLALLTDDMLSKLLYSFTLPFLRRCAIIYYATTGTYPVTKPSIISSFTSKTSEYSRLLSLLGVPRPTETLGNPSSTETPIVARWITQWALHGRVMPVLEFPGTYELFRLPFKWEDLVLYYADKNCGAVVGMFADIRRWTLLYLYAGSGSFGPMPYLDTHGELDVSMRRGHRQYMHVGRMDELRRGTWLMHTIPHITARKLELTLDHGGWGSLTYYIEDCVEVVVPVGGKVEISLSIDEKSLQECGVEEAGVSDKVWRKFASTLEANSEVLSLAPHMPVAKSRTDPTTLILTPSSSLPTANPCSSNIIPTGHPIAYLKKIDIHCYWSQPKIKTDGIETIDMNRPDQIKQNTEGQKIDEISFDDDILISLNHTSDDTVQENGVLLQTDWLNQQVNTVLNRLLVGHFIRRFPLIFDGQLAKVIPTFAIPQSLTNSLAHASHLAKTHGTPLNKRLQMVMSELATLQLDVLSSSVMQAENIPMKKDWKTESVRKRQKRAKQRNSNSELSNCDQVYVEQLPTDQVKESVKNQMQGKELDDNPTPRATAYINQVETSVNSFESQYTSQQEAKKIQRIVGDALAHIGRSNFMAKRRYGGRLAYGVIKILHVDWNDALNNKFPFSDAPLFFKSYPQPTLTASQSTATTVSESFIDDTSQEMEYASLFMERNELGGLGEDEEMKYENLEDLDDDEGLMSIDMIWAPETDCSPSSTSEKQASFLRPSFIPSLP
ncbi:hypothetical protein L204_101071 [Cryptococcus depauperatus]